jgi:hypothetical protein
MMVRIYFMLVEQDDGSDSVSNSGAGGEVVKFCT